MRRTWVDIKLSQMLTPEELRVVVREAERLQIEPVRLVIRWLLGHTHEVCRREAIERGDEP